MLRKSEENGGYKLALAGTVGTITRETGQMGVGGQGKDTDGKEKESGNVEK